MKPILAMAQKDIRLLVRDRMGFFFSFVFPLLYATFFGMVFAGDDANPGLPVVVVDEDSTASSRAFIDTLKAGGELQVAEAGREEAVQAVRRGRKIAYIALPPGFGAARKQMFSQGPPEIEIGLDPARKAEGGMIEGILTKYMAESLQENFSNPTLLKDQIAGGVAALDSATGLSAENTGVLKNFLAQLDTLMSSGVAGDSNGGGFAGLTPVVIRKSGVVRQRSGPRSSYEFSFPQGILWGILSTAFGFALSLVIERRSGTLIRLRSAPISRAGILAGKAVACFVTILTVTTVLLTVAVAVFGVRPDSVPLLILAVLSTAIGFVGLMMVISVLGRTEASVSGLGWALMMVMAMTGGGMIPLFILPSWVQTIGNLSPVKWGILAIEGAIWRGFTPAEMLLPCGILLGVGGLGFVVGARAFRWTEV
jgi:ABC-2 type transport system permease protein